MALYLGLVLYRFELFIWILLDGLEFATDPYREFITYDPSLAKTILLSVEAPGKVKLRGFEFAL